MGSAFLSSVAADVSDDERSLYKGEISFYDNPMFGQKKKKEIC
jgi:hypothetical protein